MLHSKTSRLFLSNKHKRGQASLEQDEYNASNAYASNVYDTSKPTDNHQASVSLTC